MSCSKCTNFVPFSVIHHLDTFRLMDPMGGIVMTNDGNCDLREITVKHPPAKSMIDISRAQDEETGDGTTSIIVLGEFLID